MRIIKLGFISLLFFSLLITGFSLFIPSRVRISRAMNTGVTGDSVFNEVKDINRWKNWYPGFDSAGMKGLVTGDPGFITKDGRMGINLSMVTDSMVIATFDQDNQRAVKQTWMRIIHPMSDSVTIHWSMDFRLRWYPWEKFSGLMFEKRYGPLMEQGLANLGKQAAK